MKQIYFVLTDTNTPISKIIKYFMKDEFSHVSISLDKNLNSMYSLGRLKPYNPLHGGFVHEYVDKGTFKRFYKTKSMINYINVTDEQFEKLEKTIEETWNRRKEIKFNTIGLFAVYFKKKRKKENYFYCAEYIKYATEKSNIDLNLPELPRPENFKYLDGSKVIYKGLLKEYCK